MQNQIRLVLHEMPINIFRRLGRQRDPSDYVSSINQLVARERVGGEISIAPLCGRVKKPRGLGRDFVLHADQPAMAALS
jgi:hypothetical protein